MTTNSMHRTALPGCRVCLHQHEGACADQAAAPDSYSPCERFEGYGERLGRELAFVDRHFFIHQIAGLALAMGLGLGLSWFAVGIGF